MGESVGLKHYGKGRKNPKPFFPVWNTQWQASAPIHPVHTVQHRTEIPMSTAAMKFSWQSLVWSEGLYAPAMGTCPGCNALFKNTHSIQASGDTFLYSVRSSKCNSAEEETFFFSRAHGAEPEEGQVDKGDVGVDVLYRRAVSEGNWRSGPQRFPLCIL